MTLDAQLVSGRSIIVGVMTFTGVDQDAPLGSFFSAHDNSAGPAQVSVTDSATGELVYSVVGCENEARPIAVDDETERWNLDPGGGADQSELGGGSTEAGAAGSVLMKWTLSDVEHWAIGAVSIKPAATPGVKWHVRLNSLAGDGTTTGALRTEIEGDEEVATTALNDNSWHYVASVLTGTTMADVVHYVDGADDGTTGAGGSTTVNTNTAGDKVTLGARTQSTVKVFQGGILDDIRISNIARSANWIKTEYTNQYSPSTFITLGDEERAIPAWDSGNWANVGVQQITQTDPESNIPSTSGYNNLQVYNDGTNLFFQFFVESAPDETSTFYGVLIDDISDTDQTHEFAIATHGSSGSVKLYDWGASGPWTVSQTYGSGYLVTGDTDRDTGGTTAYEIQFALGIADLSFTPVSADEAKAVTDKNVVNALEVAEGSGGKLNTNDWTPGTGDGDYTTPADIPEFHTISLPTAGIIALFVIIRRKKRPNKNDREKE